MSLEKYGIVFVALVSACCWSQAGAQQTAGGDANVPAATGTPAPASSQTANAPQNASANGNASPAASQGSAPDTTSPAGRTSADSAFPSIQHKASKAEASRGTMEHATADRDPLLDLPPLPKGKVALQGGTLVRVDPVRDRLVMTPFQGKRQEIAFDVRTQFMRDGRTIQVRDLKPGTPIYADTIWDGQRVFAKSIRVFTSTHQDQEHGQILGFDAASGSLRVRDELFPAPVDLKVNSNTVIRKNQSPATTADLKPGSLVAIKFQPGSHGQALQIDVLATRGAPFAFSGPVTHIDLLTHVIGISNRSDSVFYDIHFDPTHVKITPDLQEGADVDIDATFDGTQYLANTIAVRSARASD